MSPDKTPLFSEKTAPDNAISCLIKVHVSIGCYESIVYLRYIIDDAMVTACCQQSLQPPYL